LVSDWSSDVCSSDLSESPLHYRFAGGFVLIVPSVLFIFAVRRYLFAMWGIANR